MDLSFIETLVDPTNIEKNGQSLKIKFSGPETPVQKEKTVELLQILFNKRLKLKSLSFSLKNQEEKNFLFNLENPDTSLSCASKNGALSLYLTDREVKDLQKRSGQRDNRVSNKTVIYAFDPENLNDSNYTIFFTKDLQECVVENP